MKKYKVTASYLTYCTLEIEAKNEDEAWQIARESEGGDFEPLPDIDDWYIEDVQLIQGGK
jgi:hypothetical protein